MKHYRVKITKEMDIVLPDEADTLSHLRESVRKIAYHGQTDEGRVIDSSIDIEFVRSEYESKRFG